MKYSIFTTNKPAISLYLRVFWQRCQISVANYQFPVHKRLVTFLLMKYSSLNKRATGKK